MTEGLNQVYCMDALDLLRGLPEACVDLIVTSPPYDKLRTYNGFSFDFEGIAQESYRVLKQGGVLMWVVGDATVNGSETLTSMRQAIYFVDSVNFRMHDTMIYHRQGRFPEVNRYWQEFEYMFVLSKGQPVVFNPMQRRNKRAGERITTRSRNPDGSMFDSIAKREGRGVKAEGDLGNVVFFNAGYNLSTKDEFAFEHPAMFPEKLAECHILTWSNPGDLVLDYFGGSGTTAKMARNNNRNYLTCDISEEYCELMRKRLTMPYTLPMPI